MRPGLEARSKLCDESRSHPQGSAAFSFARQFLAARTGGREPCRFLARVSRSSNPFELPPSFGSEGVGCCKPKFLGGRTWLNPHPPPRNHALVPHPPPSTASQSKPATTPRTSTKCCAPTPRSKSSSKPAPRTTAKRSHPPAAN